MTAYRPVCEPIQLVSVSENGKLVFQSEAKHKLLESKGNVTVISCMGKCGTGKSYLMSRLFGMSRSFQTGTTCQKFTNGVWVLTKPHPKETGHTLVLMDVEGLYDIASANEDADMKMSVVTLLSSSTVINNISHSLSYRDMQDLHKMLTLAKKWISNTGNEDQLTFPHMHFLILDHFLELKAGEKSFKDNPCGYLEWLLKRRRNDASLTISSHNKVLLDIHSCFPSRDLHTLCRPSDDNAVLATLDRVRDTKLKPEFVEQWEVFEKAVFSKSSCFNIGGGVATMKRWLNHVEQLVNSHHTKIPDVPCSTEAMVTEINRKVNQDAVRDFENFYQQKKAMRMPFPLQGRELLDACETEKANILTLYRSKSFDASLDDAMVKMNDMTEKFFKQNFQHSFLVLALGTAAAFVISAVALGIIMAIPLAIATYLALFFYFQLYFISANDCT